MTVPDPRRAQAGSPAIWGDVPARNKNFTGREDVLARLREGSSSRVSAVLPESDSHETAPQGVHGLGGIGKTALAIEYAYRFSSDYDLVWWIPADQLSSVRGSLAALARRLGVNSQPMSGIDGLITAVLDALCRGKPYSRWLLIFDNADEPEDINVLIPRGTGDVLVTSRNHRWQSLIQAIPMDVFHREESRQFLLKRVSKGLSDSHAERVADELGDLPLALEQAGAMLRETGMSADEYLRLLEEHVTSIMDEGKAPDYPYSMTAAWELSVNALTQQRPEALELLRCCAFFGPEPIPRDVFRRGASETGTSVAEVLSNPIQSASAMRELARYALITLDRNTVKVHRLVQALIRDALTGQQRADYRNETHLILAAGAPKNPNDAATWSQFQGLLPHVNASITELHRSREPVVRDFARAAMRYLYQSGDYTSALALTERCIEQWITDSGQDSPDVLRAQRHLGNIQRLLGHYLDAYQVTEKALDKCRVIMGEAHPTTLVLRTGFAADLRALGTFRAALELDEESRVLHENTYRRDDPRTLRLLSSLALDYGLVNDYDTALDLYNHALRSMNRQDSASAVDILGAMNGLAWALRLTGNFDESFDVSLEAMDYGRASAGLGPDHLATLRAVNTHLVVSRRLPDKQLDGLELGQRTLELMKRRYGDRHPDTLALTINVSNLLRTIDESYHHEALALAKDAAEWYPTVYGEKHPYNHGCKSNLALLMRTAGDLDRAFDLDDEALKGANKALGEGRYIPLIIAMNRASDLAALGRAGEALDCGKDILTKLTALVGPNHWRTLGCAANLALDMMATGDEEGGITLRDDTLQRFEGHFGRDYPDAVAAARGDRLNTDFDPPAI